MLSYSASWATYTCLHPHSEGASLGSFFQLEKCPVDALRAPVSVLTAAAALLINASWVNSCETSVPEKSPYSPETVCLRYTFFISITSLNKRAEFLVWIRFVARLGFSRDSAPFTAAEAAEHS